MTLLLASGNPLGLRAVGSGGRSAVSSYEQIARTLRQSLGPAHAALFAEPNRRANMVDWFSAVETTEKPIRLIEAPADRKDRAMAELERLVNDIGGKAAELGKSDRQDERILGEMIIHALNVPDEDAIFLLGEQPVMTFWGYVRDQGQANVTTVDSLLRRGVGRPPPLAQPTTHEQPKTLGQPDAVNEAPQTTQHARSFGYVSRGPSVRGIAPALLWTAFALLLTVCGIELLRGCAIGFPHSLTGWVLDYCSASNVSVLTALAEERSKQDQLRAEYEELVRQAALKRQACLFKADKAEQRPRDSGPSKVVVVPPTNPVKIGGGDQMRIPDKKKGFDFIEGCWRAQEGLTATTADGRDTGKKLKITYCFNKDGTGSRTVRYEEDNAKCVGSANASFTEDILSIALGSAQCDTQHLNFRAANDRCRRGDNGVAICDETADGSNKSNFKDTPFTRTTDEP